MNGIPRALLGDDRFTLYRYQISRDMQAGVAQVFYFDNLQPERRYLIKFQVDNLYAEFGVKANALRVFRIQMNVLQPCIHQLSRPQAHHLCFYKVMHQRN